MDSRDGKRQGLPWDAAEELLFLVDLCIVKRALAASLVSGMPFAQMYDVCVAKAQDFTLSEPGGADPWADPRAITDVGRRGRGESRPSPKGSGMCEKKTWWRRFFG
jgi:hypothetical protein